MFRPPGARGARSLRRGAAAIEFALCLVFVFVPLMAAIFEWSWYFYQEVTIMRIARDAARVGVMGADTVTDAQAAEVARNWANSRLQDLEYDLSGTEVEVTYPADSINAGTHTRDLLKLQIEIPYVAIIGLLPEGGEPPDHLKVVYEMAR